MLQASAAFSPLWMVLFERSYKCLLLVLSPSAALVSATQSSKEIPNPDLYYRLKRLNDFHTSDQVLCKPQSKWGVGRLSLGLGIYMELSILKC